MNRSGRLATTLCDHLQKIIPSVLIKLGFNHLNSRYLRPPSGGCTGWRSPISGNRVSWVSVDILFGLELVCLMSHWQKKGMFLPLPDLICPKSWFLVPAGHCKQSLRFQSYKWKQQPKSICFFPHWPSWSFIWMTIYSFGHIWRIYLKTGLAWVSLSALHILCNQLSSPVWTL